MSAPARMLTAFEGTTRLATGSLDQIRQVILAAAQVPAAAILIFDDATGEQIDIDLRETGSVSPRHAAAAGPGQVQSRRAGRPKLGVVGREVTLLPRHWDWLARQPGGASVALRRIIDDARKVNVDKDLPRLRQAAAYRFMSAMAGNLPGFEEAIRALFADDLDVFVRQIAAWPGDVRAYAERLASGDETTTERQELA